MNNAILALNDLKHALENVLPAGISCKNSATAIELIFRPVAASYTGNLESSEDHDGGICYRPSNGNEIREILTDLWGEYLPAMLREKIAEQIIREGTSSLEDWPEAFCDDLADNYRDRVSNLDHDLEVIAERKKATAAEIAKLSARMMVLEAEEKRLHAEIKWWSARWNETAAATNLRTESEANCRAA
jgi:hypothetical protein